MSEVAATAMPIYVFAVPGVFPGEFSAEAESQNAAHAALWAQLSDAQRNASELLEMIEVYEPEGRAPEMQPMGVQDFAMALKDWIADPGSYDLYSDNRYPQHEACLREVQRRKEAEWEQGARDCYNALRR